MLSLKVGDNKQIQFICWFCIFFTFFMFMLCFLLSLNTWCKISKCKFICPSRIFFILMKATVKKIEELIQRNIHLPKSHPRRKSGEIKVNCNNKILSFNFLFNLFLSPIKICAQINIDSIQIAGIQIQPSYI